MNLRRIRAVVGATAVALLVSTVGCASDSSRGGMQADAGAESEEAASAGAMSGSDADRAKDAIRRNRRTGDRRPAGPPARTGTRVVDQPRP